MTTANMLTATAAAKRLNVSRFRVYALIRDGLLPATKWGRDWMIAEADVSAYRPRPNGRPRKVKPVVEFTDEQVQDLNRQLQSAAERLWDTHPNNPKNQHSKEEAA